MKTLEPGRLRFAVAEAPFPGISFDVEQPAPHEWAARAPLGLLTDGRQVRGPTVAQICAYEAVFAILGKSQNLSGR